MRTLNLNDETAVKRLQFSGGERHVELLYEGFPPLELRAILRTPGDLIDLLLLTDLLKQKDMMPRKLIIPYMPYGRQDRYTTDKSCFSLRVAAELINSLGFAEVHTYEPHSDVTPALIRNCRVHTSDSAVMTFINGKFPDLSKLVLMAPDVGAVKRVERFEKYRRYVCGQYNELSIAVALKYRNPATGRVEITRVDGNLSDKDVLVIDDLCDGGQTFIALADYIYKDNNPKSLNLFVAHGIFSKGTDCIANRYVYTGTTNSFYNLEDDRITVYQSI